MHINTVGYVGFKNFVIWNHSNLGTPSSRKDGVPDFLSFIIFPAVTISFIIFEGMLQD